MKIRVFLRIESRDVIRATRPDSRCESPGHLSRRRADYGFRDHGFEHWALWVLSWHAREGLLKGVLHQSARNVFLHHFAQSSLLLFVGGFGWKKTQIFKPHKTEQNTQNRATLALCTDTCNTPVCFTLVCLHSGFLDGVSFVRALPRRHLSLESSRKARLLGRCSAVFAFFPESSDFSPANQVLGWGASSLKILCCGHSGKKTPFFWITAYGFFVGVLFRSLQVARAGGRTLRKKRVSAI